MSNATVRATTEIPTYADLTRVFGRIGLISFGGPAAQIALMHRELVELRPWLTERDFLSALSFCMLLPGPEAMQLATYAGWKLRGVRGGLIAGGLFVMPGALVVLALAVGYAYLGEIPLVQALFLGIKATVIIVVLQALLKLARKSLTEPAHWVIAALSFLAIFAFNLPFPVIILVSAIWGALSTTARPMAGPSASVEHRRTLLTIVVWLGLWFLPLGLIWASGSNMLLDLALFFSELAVVTFGGAYAVLAYMTQEVVGNFGWLTTAEMMDGLGLAETTPGPLILVTEFVGFLAGFREAGLAYGILAAAITLWMTFVPCFLWIFAGGPYLDWISRQPRLAAALEAITAAVVGVILNLSVWFALHVVFRSHEIASVGPMQVIWPDPRTIDFLALALSLLAAVLLLRFRLPLIPVLAAMAIAGAFSAAILQHLFHSVPNPLW